MTHGLCFGSFWPLVFSLATVSVGLVSFASEMSGLFFFLTRSALASGLRVLGFRALGFFSDHDLRVRASLFSLH